VSLGLCLAAGPAWADALKLANGRTIEGVIVDESDDEIRLQVSWQGFIIVKRASVTSVSRETDLERQRRVIAWRREFEADEERDQARRAVEAQQRAQGLMVFEGQWVTPEYVAEVRERRRVDEAHDRAEALRRDELQSHMERLARRVEGLEAENRRLRVDLLKRERQRIIVVPQPFVVRPHPFSLDIGEDRGRRSQCAVRDEAPRPNDHLASLGERDLRRPDVGEIQD